MLRPRRKAAPAAATAPAKACPHSDSNIRVALKDSMPRPRNEHRKPAETQCSSAPAATEAAGTHGVTPVRATTEAPGARRNAPVKRTGAPRSSRADKGAAAVCKAGAAPAVATVAQVQKEEDLAAGDAPGPRTYHAAPDDVDAAPDDVAPRCTRSSITAQDKGARSATGGEERAAAPPRRCAPATAAACSQCPAGALRRAAAPCRALAAPRGKGSQATISHDTLRTIPPRASPDRSECIQPCSSGTAQPETIAEERVLQRTDAPGAPGTTDACAPGQLPSGSPQPRVASPSKRSNARCHAASPAKKLCSPAKAT
jgi:hypothetical protein